MTSDPFIIGLQTSTDLSDNYMKLKAATQVETNLSVSDLLTGADKVSVVPATMHEEYTSGPLTMHNLDSFQ